MVRRRQDDSVPLTELLDAAGVGTPGQLVDFLAERGDAVVIRRTSMPGTSFERTAPQPPLLSVTVCRDVHRMRQSRTKPISEPTSP